ncbi:MAG: DUF2294 domain-containing protein [Planctomycetota bacterium]
MTDRTRGQLEADMSAALIQFEREYMGRGPDEAKSYLIEDMLLVRLRRVLTPAEKHLAETGDMGGRALVKQVRSALLEKGRPLLEEIVQRITGKRVTSLHTDISTVTGERMIIFTLDGFPDLAADKPPADERRARRRK